MSLLDPSHSPSLLSHSDATFFTSGLLCLTATSAVLVFTVMANLAHAFLLYAEQALYATDVTAYMTLICSPKTMAAVLISAWLGPLALALLPLSPGQVLLCPICSHPRHAFFSNRFKQLARILLPTGCVVEAIPLCALHGADLIRDSHIGTIHEGPVEGKDGADIQARHANATGGYPSDQWSMSADNCDTRGQESEQEGQKGNCSSRIGDTFLAVNATLFFIDFANIPVPVRAARL